MVGVVCPTPKNHCTGSTSNLIPGLPGCKTHTDGVEAYNCYVHYLKSQGYTEADSPHSFRPPDGGPLLVLGRPRHFGLRLRRGKDGGRQMPYRENRGGIA